MGALAGIIAISTIMWFIIDKFKVMWSGVKFGKWITTIVSAAFGFGLTFGFGLNIITALGIGVTEVIPYMGQVITGLVFMSGSSAVAEIIEAIKGKDEKEDAAE